MNLIYGEITELFRENDMQMGTVRVSGVLKKVPLNLLTNVRRGDTVLICDGVAISKVKERPNHVSGDSR